MSSSDSNYADPDLDFGVLEATPKRKAKILDMANKLAQSRILRRAYGKAETGEIVGSGRGNQNHAYERGDHQHSRSGLGEDNAAARGNRARDFDKRGVRSCRAGQWLRCDCEIETKHPYPNKSDRPAPISDDQTSRTDPFTHATLARCPDLKFKMLCVAEAATGRLGYCRKGFSRAFIILRLGRTSVFTSSIENRCPKYLALSLKSFRLRYSS